MNKITKNKLRIIIVRHGETVDNVALIIQGHQPGKLNKNGENQAREAGKNLKHIDFDFKMCSDLRRCVNTFKFIESQFDNDKTKSEKLEIDLSLSKENIEDIVKHQAITQEKRILGKKKSKDDFKPDLKQFLFWKIIKVLYSNIK